jgi:hypothetical protein
VINRTKGKVFDFQEKYHQIYTVFQVPRKIQKSTMGKMRPEIGEKRIPGDIDCLYFKATVTKIIEQKVSDSIKQHIPFTTYGYRN